MRNLNPDTVIAIARAAGAAEVLRFLARGGTDKEVGRRALLLAFLLCPDAIATQRELAGRIGVTEARVSQMLRVFKRAYPGLLEKSQRG